MDAGAIWAQSERRRHRRSNVFLALLISLGGAVVLTTAAGARRTDSAFDRFVESSRSAHVQVQYSTAEDIDAAVLEAFRQHPDVEVATPLFFTVAFADGSEYDQFVVSGPEPALFRDIDRPRVLEGRRPDPSAPDEVMISRFMQQDLGVEVGDRITFGTFAPDVDLFGPDFEPSPGPDLEVEVVGIATLPADAADAAFGYAMGTSAFHERYASQAAGFGPSVDLLLRDGADEDAVVADVMEDFVVDELLVNTAADTAATVDDATRALVLGLWAFTGVALLAFLVATAQAIRRRLETGQPDQGTLRAIGLRPAQRARALAMTVAPAVAVGIVLAALLSIPASSAMPFGGARRAEPDPGIRLDPAALLVGAMVLAALLVAATAWSARQATRRTAIASGRGSAVVARATAVQAIRRQLDPAANLGVTMALDPDSRRGPIPVRSAFLGAIVGAAGVAGVLTFGAGLDALVDDPARSGWNWTLRVDPADEEELTEIAALPGTEDVAHLLQRQVMLDGEDVPGNALASVKGTPAFTIIAGRMPAADDEVALGPELADRAEVGIGDQVTMTAMDGTEVSKVVVGRALFPTFDEDSAFNDGVALTPVALEALARSDGEGNDTVIVSVQDDVSTGEAAERIRAIAPEAVSVYSFPVPPSDVANLDDVRPLPRALAIFLAILGLAAVGHALATSVRHRRRELGTVRSLGFVGGQVRGAVTVQSTTMVVGGLLLGIPLGVVLGRTTWRAVAEGLGVVSTPTVPVVLLLALVPLSLVAAVALAWFPARSARRGVALDALRSE